MSFNHTRYIPCLRWKRGEYEAVFRLLAPTRRIFTPLIEVPEIGWDFEDETPNERMAGGIHPVSFVFDGLRQRMCSAVPVTGLDRDNAYQREIRKVVNKSKSGICLRIKIEQAAKVSLKDDVDSLLSRLNIKSESCDLIIDLGAPNFIPLEGFSMAIQRIVSKLPYLNDWRTFTILGTSFPDTMAGIKLGVQIIPRYEWQLYKKVVNNFKKVNFRIPTFGDYGISHPKVIEQDMRMLKPSVAIRYTIDNGWYIVKGKNYKDYGLKQYHELSRQVLGSKYFFGTAFSWGDKYIQECANRNEKPGNLTTWRQVGTNHHIEKVIRDIASFYASSSSL